jgi:hypothetical protein
MKYSGLVFVLVVFIFGCTKNTSRIFEKKAIKKAGIDERLLKSENFEIRYSSDTQNSLDLQYLGSGGYYLGNGTDAILIDPFFSHHSFLSLPLKKIRTRPSDVNYGLKGLESDIYNKVGGIFITHTHYDHFMDVPYTFNHFIDTLRKDFKIYGTGSVQTLIGGIIDSVNFKNMDSDIATLQDPGKWFYTGKGTIRVKPILCSHAPHFKFIVPVYFYKGEPKPMKKYNSDTTKTSTGQWKGGETLAYLVDFMHESEIKFRIFILSSASAPDDGFFPKEVLNEHPIDLAIMGAASFSYVENYPEGIIDFLKPERVIICHWEDFFNPYQDSPKRTVRFTNIKKYLLRMNQKYPWLIDDKQMFYMPEPGVNIKVEY